MASERLTNTTRRLAEYYAAETAILAGQSYTMGSRSLTRANISWVQKQIKEFEDEIEELKAAEGGRGRRKSFRITPRDL